MPTKTSSKTVYDCFSALSSETWCGSPYIEWGKDGILCDLDDTQVLNEQRSPWPVLAYFGPPCWAAISDATPRLKDVGYVYHLLDVWHRVLYVGKSGCPTRRIPEHRPKVWWPDVRKVRIFSSMEYHLLELADIKALNPLHNIVGRS